MDQMANIKSDNPLMAEHKGKLQQASAPTEASLVPLFPATFMTSLPWNPALLDIPTTDHRRQHSPPTTTTSFKHTPYINTSWHISQYVRILHIQEAQETSC